MKKLVISLGTILFLFVSYMLSAGDLFTVTRTYSFKPNAPINIDNTSSKVLDAECVLETQSSGNKMAAVMKKNNAIINGKSVNEGKTISLAVKNRQTFHIIIDVDAQVEVTNFGNSTITATCKK